MTPVVAPVKSIAINNADETMDILLRKLNEAFEDVEDGRVQTIDDAWEEINTI